MDENRTMVPKVKISGRRTSVEAVFDHLYSEIMSMRLLPGTKISEAEIASLFDVSRQPVRDAFSRLENLDLLLIQPQKATEVKRFSSSQVTTSRFVRAAIESEVLRRAARECTEEDARLLEAHLSKQSDVVADNNYDKFRPLDYEFHKLLCTVARVDYAFDVISNEKVKVDRLCALGLTRNERLDQLFDDHKNISERVSSNDETGAVEAGMLHLSRLDETIEEIQKEKAEYFYD